MQPHIKHTVEHGERLAAIEAELPYIRKSLDGIEKGVERMAEAIKESTEQTQKMIGDVIHTHQNKQELEIERVDKRIDAINIEVKSIDERLSNLESDKKALTWLGKILHVLLGSAITYGLTKVIAKWVS